MQSIDRFSISSSEASEDSEPESPYPRTSMANRDGQTTMYSSTPSDPSSSSNGNPTREQLESQSSRKDLTAMPGVRSDAVIHSVHDFLEVSDKLPSKEDLAEAADIPVYDSHQNPRSFKSLYSGPEHDGQRQLIVFVRHFYCLACQAFMKMLVDTLDPHAYFSLPVPTTITIIGCGKPKHIPRYASQTTCPFKVYTEPTRRLHKTLDLMTSSRMGPRPGYTGAMNHADIAIGSLARMIKAGYHDVRSAGNFFQLGGEFLFQEGQPVWCHRMRTVRGHVEMSVIKRVLEMADTDDQSDTSPAPDPSGQRSSGAPRGWKPPCGAGDDASKTCGPPVSSAARGLRLVKEGGRGSIQAYWNRDRRVS